MFCGFADFLGFDLSFSYAFTQFGFLAIEVHIAFYEKSQDGKWKSNSASLQKMFTSWLKKNTKREGMLVKKLSEEFW